MDKQLRLITGAIVIESKLSKSAKLQLLNFIENEAKDVQIKALLLDGEILTDIDEQTEEIINNRFKNHPIYEGWGDIAVGATQAATGAVSRDLKRKAAQKRIQSIQLRIKKLNTAMKKCGDSKLCKASKYAQLVAARNALADAKAAARQ